MTILHIDSSPRFSESVSRALSQTVVDKLRADHPGATVTRRDVVTTPLPYVSHDMIAAFYTPPAQLSEEQKTIVALSNTITEEIKAADAVVVGVPMWNFGVPASLKAWFDLVARVGVTFKYGESGPIGLLTGKKAYFTIATGGTPIGGDWDFTSGHLKTFFAFLGIADSEVIAADQIQGQGGEERIAEAKQEAAAV